MTEILAALSGIFLGVSSYLGFRPAWPQPKNLIIQVIGGLIGIAFAAAMLYYLP